MSSYVEGQGDTGGSDGRDARSGAPSTASSIRSGQPRQLIDERTSLLGSEGAQTPVRNFSEEADREVGPVGNGKNTVGSSSDGHSELDIVCSSGLKV